MKDQPWNINQTWPVGWKQCWFTNASPPQKNGGPPPEFGAHQIFDHFFRDFHTRHCIQNEMSHRQTKC